MPAGAAETGRERSVAGASLRRSPIHVFQPRRPDRPSCTAGTSAPPGAAPGARRIPRRSTRASSRAPCRASRRRQQPLILGPAQRPDMDVEMVLRVQDARPSTALWPRMALSLPRKPAPLTGAAPGPCADAARACAVCATQRRTLRARQLQPARAEGLHSHRHAEVALEDRRQSFRMPRGPAEVAGEMPLRLSKLALRPLPFGRAVAEERADVGPVAILRRPVVRCRRLRLPPGAIEHQQQAVVEDVGEAREGGVAMVALAIAHEFRQVQRQRPLRPEQAEEAHRHPRQAAAGLADAGDVDDWKARARPPAPGAPARPTAAAPRPAAAATGCPLRCDAGPDRSRSAPAPAAAPP